MAELQKVTAEMRKSFTHCPLNDVVQWTTGRLLGNLYITARLEREQTLLIYPPLMENTPCLKALTMNYAAHLLSGTFTFQKPLGYIPLC